jgi:hypothetical protein
MIVYFIFFLLIHSCLSIDGAKCPIGYQYGTGCGGCIKVKERFISDTSQNQTCDEFDSRLSKRGGFGIPLKIVYSIDHCIQSYKDGPWLMRNSSSEVFVVPPDYFHKCPKKLWYFSCNNFVPRHPCLVPKYRQTYLSTENACKPHFNYFQNPYPVCVTEIVSPEFVDFSENWFLRYCEEKGGKLIGRAYIHAANQLIRGLHVTVKLPVDGRGFVSGHI